MADTFKCEMCDGEFNKEPGDDAMAKKEFDRLFPTTPPEDMATVCDDCFRSIFGETASIH